MADNTIVRGDVKYWTHCLTDPDGDPLDLTGCTVWFTAKAAPDSDELDDSALIRHYIVIDGAGTVTSSLGLSLGGTDYNQEPPTVVSGAASGVLTNRLSPATSDGLAAGTLVYDIQVELPNDDIHTPVNGLPLPVVADITRRTSTP